MVYGLSFSGCKGTEKIWSVQIFVNVFIEKIEKSGLNPQRIRRKRPNRLLGGTTDERYSSLVISVVRVWLKPLRPLGDLWSTYGSPLVDLWATFGRPLGDLWEKPYKKGGKKGRGATGILASRIATPWRTWISWSLK